MPDNDFWIGQEQIPVDLSLLLTYHNDEDYLSRCLRVPVLQRQ